MKAFSMNENIIFQVKITLADIKPLIWRRILIPADYSLTELHYIIQDAFAWENSHLHQFIGKRGEYYTDPNAELENTKNEFDFTIGDLLDKPKSKLIYEYDFGDSWRHEIMLEKIEEFDPQVKYPLCINGKCCAPPEDCGGTWGYENFREIMHDPKHEEHKSMVEWHGGKFDPEAFDIKKINRDLSQERCKTLTQKTINEMKDFLT